MTTNNSYRKLSANWFRKSGYALTSLAIITTCIYFIYAIINAEKIEIIEGLPDFVIYIFLGVFAVLGFLVLFYQLITIFSNKMILNSNGIEIKRLFNYVFIPTKDVIRIDGIHEKIVGNSFQNRTVFKIITNTKTIEVNSHEFFGLQNAIRQWIQINKNVKKDGIQ